MKLKNTKTGEIVTLDTKLKQDRFFDNRDSREWVQVKDHGHE